MAWVSEENGRLLRSHPFHILSRFSALVQYTISTGSGTQWLFCIYLGAGVGLSLNEDDLVTLGDALKFSRDSDRLKLLKKVRLLECTYDWRLVTLIFKYFYQPSATVRDVSHCTRLKYCTPVTVTGHQSLYEFSVTVRDFEHYIRDWSLAYSFICRYRIS